MVQLHAMYWPPFLWIYYLFQDSAFTGPEVVFTNGYGQVPKALADGSVKITLSSDMKTFTAALATNKTPLNITYT